MPLAAVAGLGSMLGELPTYWLGYQGRGLEALKPRLERARDAWWWRWTERNGTWGLFCLAAIPNPFLDLISIGAGLARLSLGRYVLAVLAGRILRFAIIAELGTRLKL